MSKLQSLINPSKSVEVENGKKTSVEKNNDNKKLFSRQNSKNNNDFMQDIYRNGQADINEMVDQELDGNANKQEITSMEKLEKSEISIDKEQCIYHDFPYGQYYGEVKNNIPQGKGKMEYTDGWIYIGNLEQGKRHGKGKISKDFSMKPKSRPDKGSIFNVTKK